MSADSPPAATGPTVAIVGAGAAGTLTAVNLLRRSADPLRVVLIERSGSFGPGVAYSTSDEQHLLNVPAERMSAFADEPDHLVRWLAARGPFEPGTYPTRRSFGRYLRAVLDEAEAIGAAATPARRLERVAGEVLDVEVGDPGSPLRLLLADGRRIACDQLVLATGPLPSVAPIELPDDPRVVTDPWAPGAIASGAAGEVSLVIGTGLTAVDAALSLCGSGDRGRVVALSRGGVLPCAQLPGLRPTAPPPPLETAPTTVAGVERWLTLHIARMRRRGYDWRDAIDGLRPQYHALWRRLGAEEQRTFVRTKVRAWERRRHRMAPEVAAQIAALRDGGRLLIRAGTLVDVRPEATGVAVTIGPAPGRDDAPRTLRGDRVVVCTGAGTDVRRAAAAAPLLGALLRRGLVAPDLHGLGLRATAAGALLGADGHADGRLHVLGPLRRGELWETTAIREIRAQAQEVAAAIAAERG